MRDLLLPLLLHGLLLTAGAGVLRLARVRAETFGRGLALAGLSYLIGLTVVFALIQAGLVVGIPFSLPLTLALSALLTLPLLPALPVVVPGLVAGARGLDRGRLRSTPVLVGVALAVFWLYALVAAAGIPLTEYDAWAIWTHKATIFFFESQVPVDTFSSPAFVFAHPDYPLTMPLWEAAHFRALGSVDTSQVHALMWMLLPAWAGGAIALAPRRAPRLVVLTVVAATAVLVTGALMTAYADAPLALLLSLAVLALGRWLLEGDRSDLVVGALLLGGAAQLKNEGILGGVVLLVALAIAARRRPGAAKHVAIAGVAWLAVFIAPWKVWLAANDIHGDLPLGKVLDPGYLIDHAGRLGPTWRQLVENIATGGLLTVPLVAVAALIVIRPAARGLRTFVVLTLLGYTASLVLVYWISPYEILWHLNTSISRVLVPLGMIGAGALLLLSATPDDETPPKVGATTTPLAVPDR